MANKPFGKQFQCDFSSFQVHFSAIFFSLLAITFQWSKCQHEGKQVNLNLLSSLMWFVIHSSVCISMQIRKSLSFPLNRLYICGCEGEGDEWRDWASRITNIQSERAARGRKKIFNSFVESYWCCWRHCTPLFTIGWCRYFFFILMSNVFPVFPKSLSVREGYMWSTDKLCHMYA